MKNIWLSRCLPLVLALGAVTLLTGCFDTKQEFTVNPDGSGKVVHESAFQKLQLSNETDTSPETLKESIREILEQSKGVDAWRDVSYKRLEDGRLFFRGTAYFKNLSQLQIANQTLIQFTWRKLGDGNIVLDVRTEKNTNGTTKAKASSGALTNLSPAEQKKKLAEERAKFQQAKPMLTAILGSMKQQTVLHLPGRVKDSSNFEQDDSGALKLQFDGTRLVTAMEKLVTDDEWLKKRVAVGEIDATSPPAFDKELNGMLFGKAAPLQAALTQATQPLFDYATELAVAQKEFAKIQRELGLGAITIAPPAQGEPLKGLRVVGVRLVGEVNKQLKLRPFNYEPGYTLALLAELPGSVLAVTDKSTLQTAVTDDGTSLLPDSEWNRRIHFPKLAEDKGTVLFEVQLKPPGSRVKGLKELTGVLQYSTAADSKEIDLGITELKEGVKGTELGAEIQSISEGWKKDGSQQMRLKLRIGHESLKKVWVVVDGVKTQLEQRGYSGGGNSFTFDLESKRAFPKQARLVVEVYDQLHTFDAPFKLHNITLLGLGTSAAE